MRLHTDTLTRADLAAAVERAGLRPGNLTVTEHGSRSHTRAWNVYLTGTSSRRTNSSSGTEAHAGHAATWDEWGMFLADLYRRDPGMVAGSPGAPVYTDARDFHTITHGRFRYLTPDEQHGGAGHRWEVTVPGVQMECTRGRTACGATAEQYMRTISRRAAMAYAAGEA